MATFSYEELEMRYNPYTKQIEQIDVSDAELEQFRAEIEINKDNIELKVSSDEILSEINLSTEGVYIKGDRIQLNGDVDVQGSFSITDISDAGPLADANYIRSSDLSSYSSDNNGIYITSAGIRGVYNSEETFKVSATDGSATFKGTINATGGEISGDLDMTSGGSLTVDGGNVNVIGSGGIYVANADATDILGLKNISGVPMIHFTDNDTLVGYIEGIESKSITVDGSDVVVDVISTMGNTYTAYHIFGGMDLAIEGVSYLHDINISAGEKIIYTNPGGGDGTMYYDDHYWYITDDGGTHKLGDGGGSSNDYGRDDDGKFQLPVGSNLY